MTTAQWPAADKLQALPLNHHQSGWLVLFFSVAILCLQLLSVTHNHQEEPPSLADTCLICSANSISGAASALPGTLFQLVLAKSQAIGGLHPAGDPAGQPPAFSQIRAPPASL
ncbi:MAG: hypothetical protein R3208_16935 [Ketobacteraceae bacterium]|nr:hypothetical protein [Ketobacteraceae bacterium]